MLDFPQADIDIDILMELPESMIPVSDESNLRLYILKLNKSLYSLKQESQNWYEELNQSLLDQDFNPSQIDTCIFMRNGMLLLVHVEDCIIMSDSEARIYVLIHSFKNGKEKYISTEEGSIDKFFAMSISKLDDNLYELVQPFLT